MCAACVKEGKARKTGMTIVFRGRTTSLLAGADSAPDFTGTQVRGRSHQDTGCVGSIMGLVSEVVLREDG